MKKQDTVKRRPTALELLIERIISQSRWVMAPFYLGLILSLLVLLVAFAREFYHYVTHALIADEADVILGVLALIDLSLAANLVLIVVFSGYENFVSKIDPEDHPDWPEWMTKIDFSGLKQKLMASIVAISAIQVLKAFMNIGEKLNENELMWLVGTHLVFVVSALLLAWTDAISGKAAGKEDAR
jgi:uncharacterized protein (TIGR00645 family)